MKLAALFLGTAAARFLAGLFAVKQPQFFIDELVYWSFARAFHEGAPLTLYGRALDHPVYTYPLLLSPAFSLDSSIAAFVAIQALNSLMQATVVFFAYLLARELLDERPALLVALLSALLPTGVLTSVLMAENAFLPLATLAFWLLYRTLRDGRAREGALAAAVLAVAYFTKPHALMLLAGFGVAVLAGWVRSRNARSLAARALPFASLALVA
ncbi:MAG: glycosyltransferase family 39 protein, partial [Acidobacteria bacterium]|nr:glycosyltransferase family 39 protein [Acidobacteriota bacterium]